MLWIIGREAGWTGTKGGARSTGRAWPKRTCWKTRINGFPGGAGSAWNCRKDRSTGEWYLACPHEHFHFLIWLPLIPFSSETPGLRYYYRWQKQRSIELMLVTDSYQWWRISGRVLVMSSMFRWTFTFLHQHAHVSACEWSCFHVFLWPYLKNLWKAFGSRQHIILHSDLLSKPPEWSYIIKLPVLFWFQGKLVSEQHIRELCGSMIDGEKSLNPIL